MKIQRATIEDITTIQKMADVAFRSTYAEILTPGQMEYMMDWMYSESSLKEQIQGDGKDFFIATDDNDIPIGYLAIEVEGKTEDSRPLIHLQKIYVLPSEHGKGTGRGLFAFLKEHLCKRYPQGCRVELNVNRQNTAVNFYQKMGMHQDRQGDFPIGNGFYMNDYIYAMDF